MEEQTTTWCTCEPDSGPNFPQGVWLALELFKLEVLHHVHRYLHSLQVILSSTLPGIRARLLFAGEAMFMK